jgi:hypothetical protein
VILPEPLPPMRQRGALERQVVTEAHFTAEELVIDPMQAGGVGGTRSSGDAS